MDDDELHVNIYTTYLVNLMRLTGWCFLGLLFAVPGLYQIAFGIPGHCEDVLSWCGIWFGLMFLCGMPAYVWLAGLILSYPRPSTKRLLRICRWFAVIPPILGIVIISFILPD